MARGSLGEGKDEAWGLMGDSGLTFHAKQVYNITINEHIITKKQERKE